MTNDEIPNDETSVLAAPFVIRISSFLRHSSLDIRHSSSRPFRQLLAENLRVMPHIDGEVARVLEKDLDAACVLELAADLAQFALNVRVAP